MKYVVTDEDVEKACATYFDELNWSEYIDDVELTFISMRHVLQDFAQTLGEPVAAPEGWKLVPTDPTPEMLHEAARRRYAWEHGGGAGTHHAYFYFDQTIKKDEREERASKGMWNAMLSAAPHHPTTEKGCE